MGQSVLIHQLLISFQSKMKEENRLQKDMFRLLGTLDMLMAAAHVSSIAPSDSLDADSALIVLNSATAVSKLPEAHATADATEPNAVTKTSAKRKDVILSAADDLALRATIPSSEAFVAKKSKK